MWRASDDVGVPSACRTVPRGPCWGAGYPVSSQGQTSSVVVLLLRLADDDDDDDDDVYMRE